jgi:hypothetical protein
LALRELGAIRTATHERIALVEWIVGQLALATPEELTSLCTEALATVCAVLDCQLHLVRIAEGLLPRPRPAPDMTRVLELTRSVYGAVVGALPSDRGHCSEVARLGSAMASLLGIEHRMCVGTRPWRGTRHLHSWIEAGDAILHSPARGKVELILASSAGFETTNSSTITPR